MAIIGDCGAQVDGVNGHGELFSEAGSRVVLVVNDENLQEFEDRLDDTGLPFVHLGAANGDRLYIGGANLLPLVDVAVADLAAARSQAVPAALAAGTAH
jgi:phosphoribosylformylglycinamidine (FGAM) synthase-like enzyme